MIVMPGVGAYDRRKDGLSPIVCQNLYAERVPPNLGVEWVLVKAPGQSLFAAIEGTPRGVYSAYGVFGGDIFAVYSDALYRIDRAGVATQVGTGITGDDRVFFSSVRGSLVFTAGNEAYVFDGATVAVIADIDLPAVTSLASMDGRVIFGESGTDRVYWSGIFDPANIDELAFATAETYEDKITRIIADHREIWLFGQRSIEVWRPVPDSEQPFQRIGDIVLEKGCLSPHSIAKADNTLMWVGQDAIVYRAEGAGFRRISNHGIDAALQSLTDEQLAKVYAFSYSDDGHVFYVLTIPNVQTYVYDASTGEWHTRKTDGMETWRAFDYAEAFGGHYTIADGGVYKLSRDFLKDGDASIEIMTSFNIPTQSPTPVSRFGLIASVLDNDMNEVGPKLSVSYSDNSGRDYTVKESLVVHGAGQYSQRFTLFRHGQMRAHGRVYRIQSKEDARFMIGPALINEPLH